jgi:superfamily I DNA and/or RNA helicase
VSYTARNPVEAELIASLAARLSRILVDRKTSQCYAPEKFASHGLGVLSPHRAQNSIIRQYLAEQGFDFERTPLLVDTVEKLQGKEREVILVSYGVADEEYATAEAGFLLNRNRFNVAITRALCKVIVFCSEPVLNVVSTDRKVLLESMMLKEFRSYCDTGHQTIAWKPSACNELNLHIQWKGF